jgi:hypothetical protein
MLSPPECQMAERMAQTVVARIEFSVEQELMWTNLQSRATELLTSRLSKRLINENLGVAEEQACEVEYLALVSQLDTLLLPLWNELSPEHIQGRDVVFVVDSPLWGRMPLEALARFASAKSLARDFSLPVLWRRLAAQKNKALKRNGVTYIVDPRREDKPGGGGACETLQFVKSKIGPEWKGVLGTERVPVTGEYQRLLSTSQAFVYFGFCRFLTQFEPNYMSALPCSGVSLVHLADRAENMTSFRRQNKLDNSKGEAKRSLETPFNTAVLLTLRGVDAIILNQYALAPVLNSRRFGAFWSAFGGGMSVCHSSYTENSHVKIFDSHGLFFFALWFFFPRSGKGSAGTSLHSMRAPAADCRAYDVQTTVLYGLPGLVVAEK